MRKQRKTSNQPDKFYLNLQFPPELRDQWQAVANANKRSMQAQAQVVILDTIKQFKAIKRVIIKVPQPISKRWCSLIHPTPRHVSCWDNRLRKPTTWRVPGVLSPRHCSWNPSAG